MTDPVALTNQTESIVGNARRLRDFGLLQPMDGFADLVSALRDYEMKSGERHAEVEKLQLAMARASATFEPETLNALLRKELQLPSDPPQAIAWWKKLVVLVPIVLGFLFLFTTLHYTLLTVQGTALVSKMNAALEIDLQAKGDRIVAMLRPLLPPDPRQSTSETLGIIAASIEEPEAIKRTAVEALHALEDLRNQVTTAEGLMLQIRPINRLFFYAALRDSLLRRISGGAPVVEPTQGMANFLGTFAALGEVLQKSAKTEDTDAKGQVPIPIPASYPALEEYSRYLKQVWQFAYGGIYGGGTGAALAPQYTSIMYGAERDLLLINIDITNKWTLPVLYGALGAVLYVLARHFNPFVASLNLGRVLLRITFAMFVAVTISMLFVPANVISPAVVSSPSGIFLLCFIAGYSTDTFIRFLGKLNSYFAMPATRSGST